MNSGEPAYLDVLRRVHRHLAPATYVEIGVYRGHSLRLSLPGADVVGIDPQPDLSVADESRARLFKMTSDEFFANHNLRTVLGGRPFDLAFIDGLHLFEQALSDFANLERHAHRGSVILVHDCSPMDAVSSARERTTILWSGDVWKLIVCLRDVRPDLRVSVADVAPTGMGIVTNLDPASTMLTDEREELCRRYRPLGFDDLEKMGRAESLNLVSGEWPTVERLLAAPLQPRRNGPAGPAATIAPRG